MCLAYARAGCKAITLVDLNMNGVQETVKLIEAEVQNVKLLAMEGNTTNLESVQRMVSETVKTFGSLDYGDIHQHCQQRYLTFNSCKYCGRDGQPSLAHCRVSP